MRVIILLGLSTAAFFIMGCGKQPQPPGYRPVSVEPNDQVKAPVDAGKWFRDVNQEDISERDAALLHAPNREKAMAMEKAAMNETFKKRIEMARQAQSQKLSPNQILPLDEEIVTKSEEAKSKMRLSHYQSPFQPKW